MATLTDSITIPSTADIRKSSVEQHRAKNRKVRYRNVNMNLIGQPVSVFADPENPNCKRWNDRNKFKMPRADGGSMCGCSSCSNARSRANKSGKNVSRKIYPDDMNDDYAETRDAFAYLREGVDGVLYSYDRPAGPSHGSQILTQALDIAIDKMETKQLEKLVKDEYDIVDSEESASSEDDDFELV